MANKPVKVGISIGDINGIGPEVIMKALADNRILQDCTPIIYGSSKVLAYHKKPLRLRDFSYQSVSSADNAKGKKVFVINIWEEELDFNLGNATEKGGKYAFESLERATSDLASGKIDVLVTAPISKDAMKKSGFKFPGHTEYLANLAGEDEALMIMVSPTLRVGLVTSHIPLKDIPTSLTKDKVLKKIKELASSMKKDFGIQRPRIAVFGLNPHAGENGTMGKEEQEVINPAINAAKQEGILAVGPFPADGFFGSSAKYQYDAILAMYHDQGLSAFKALAFDEGVNYTAGLPIVRTSPDHGTAFDIAGNNQASGTSMRNAIYLAIDVFRNRAFEKEIKANPLEISKEEPRRNSNKGNQNKSGKAKNSGAERTDSEK